jgi:single-stranded DNA-binding protein
MADKNEVILEGVIKGKAFAFDGKGGKNNVFKFNLEVHSEYVGSDGSLNSKACTVPVTLFGPLADKCKPQKVGDGVGEGTRMKITGYITNNSYVSKKTNERVFETIVIARTVDILGNQELPPAWEGGPPAWDDKAIPF